MKPFRIFISSVLILLTFSFPALSAQFKKARTIGPEEFMFLCESGSAEEIAKALKSGASAGISYTDGTTTLMVAAKTNTPEAVKVLLDARVNVNAKNSDGNTALLIAAQSNYNPEVIDVLIEAGAEDTSNKNAETALMLAARYNNPEVVLALVRAGADETAKSRTGETALSIAKQRGDYGIINALFDFQELCKKGSSEEIMKAIQAGAVVNMKYDMDYTPLMFASALNSAKAVETLLKADASVTASSVGDEEETALSWAVRQNSLDVINVLLNANADTLKIVSFYDEETEDFSQKTILDLASENEKLKGTNAIEILRAKVKEQSNPENQIKLGNFFYRDKKDNEEAFKWFQRAADQGNAQAQYVVALFYRDIFNDRNQYMEYLKLAVDNGNTSAQLCLGDEFAKEFSEGKTDKLSHFLSAFHYYSMVAEKGNSDAQYRLGKLYRSIPVHYSGNFYTPGFGDTFWEVCRDLVFGEIYNKNTVPQEAADQLNEFLSVVSMASDWRQIVDIKRGGGMGKEYFVDKFEQNIRTLAVKWFREAARQGHQEARDALKKMNETW